MPLISKEKDDAPILAVDIDGVISLFGFDKPVEPGRVDPSSAPGEFHLIDGMLHCIALETGPRLNQLAKLYELVWASGWEDKANFYLPNLLGLPELAHVSFDGGARAGGAHWKLGPLETFGAGRALAWIDDNFDQSCYDWAEARAEPTLLVVTEPHLGLEEAHVDALNAWAGSLH